MLSVSALNLLPAAAPSIDRSNPAATAREFDAMVLKIFLQHSGLLQSLTSAGDTQSPLFGEIFLDSVAHDLARQMNLGFGSLVVAQTQVDGQGGNR